MPWIAEVKQIFVRRTDEYGEPLTGVAVVTKSVNGVDVELLKADGFTKDDHVQLQNLIDEYFGEQCYNCERFKKLTKRGNTMATTRQKPRTKSTSRTKKTK